MLLVRDIIEAIEAFAPKSLQESYDNTGLQVGNPETPVKAILLCLDVTEEVLAEAKKRRCNMIVSHHPLLFKGLKQITGETAVQRMVIDALMSGIAIYAAHTNVDAAWNGVSHEMANIIGVKNVSTLIPSAADTKVGLGVVGTIQPTPKIEFLRKIKDLFGVKALRYSVQSPKLVVRKVALCGGSGAEFIKDAVNCGADIYITGDLKYHDFTTYQNDIILADIGHYESELCSEKIFSRIIREKYPDAVVYFSKKESNPIKTM